MAFTYAGHYFDNFTDQASGRPVFGGTSVLVYLRGTTTKATLYTSRTKGTTTANPTTLDSAGNLSVYVDPGDYDVVINGATLLLPTIPRDPSEPVKVADLDPSVTGSLGGLQPANNLSDLASPTAARSNLGLGSAATHATTDYDAAGAASAAQTAAIAAAATDATTKANAAQAAAVAAIPSNGTIAGLAPVQSVAGRTGAVVVAKSDVGLGNVDNTADTAKPVSTAQATANTTVQTTAATDATTKANAAQAAAIAASAQRASNLSDLASAGTARTNLGLGGAAVLAVGTTTGTVAAGDDTRITGALSAATAATSYAPLAGVRPAGVVLGHIGDSVAGNGNDLTRWNQGLIGFITGQSILMQACLLSGGKIVYGGSYGVAGSKVAAALTQVASAKAAGCNAVLINTGTNNVEDGSITAAQTLTDMQSVIDSVAANGMLPVVSTLPPRGDRTGGSIGNTTNSDRFNAWLWSYTRAKGYPLIDTYGALAATTNGTYATGMGADTLHPSHKGAKAVAQLVVNALTPLFASVAPGLLDSSPATNAAMTLRNPLFLTPTSGVPSQYAVNATDTSTCAADATVGLGNVWKIVRGSADGGGYTNFSVTFVTGHKYLFGFKIRASVEAQAGAWSVQLSAGTTYYLQLAAFATDLPSGSAFVGTFTAPNSTAGAFTFTPQTAVGTSVELAQLTLLDVTALAAF